MQKSSNTIYNALGRNPVHPFPARMAPEIVCSFIKRTEKPIRILDPMMGSGTVVALAQSRNHHAIGIDIDPLAILMGRVWTTPINRDSVKAKAGQVLKRASLLMPSTTTKLSFPTHAEPSTKKFIQYWFDSNSRRQLLCLSTSIARIKDTEIRDVLWCAFSRLIITKQAGASRAMDLAHSRPHRRYKKGPLKPFDGFLPAIDSVLKNIIDSQSGDALPAASVRLGDARKLGLPANSIDLVLTSPPYLNAIDYIRCSKFSLVWMGHQIDALRTLRGESVGTEVGKKYEHDAEISKIMKSLRVSKLPNRKRLILAAYVYDMRLAIAEVARVLDTGGQAIYVIGENTVKGNYIKTAKVLTQLAEAVGLITLSSKRRSLPPNKRYMPPPTRGSMTMDTRMSTEVILHFEKP